MGSQEKNVYVALIGTLLVFAGYCVLVLASYGDDFFHSSNTHLAGKSILLLMIACALANFGLRQLVKIIDRLRQKTCEDSFADERDKMIELKGLQASYSVFAVGFVASMSMLWAGWPAVLIFNMIAVSLVFGEVFSGIVKIIQYRRGY